MFPLSFSSSSSLSSLPPSLDTISEFDRGLSDISEDDDLTDDLTASHSLWALPSNTFSLFSDQQSADLALNPPASPRSSQTIVSCVEEGCVAETKPPFTNWCSWFSLRGVVKYVSFVLCFLSIEGTNGNRFLPKKLISGLTKKIRFLTLMLTPRDIVTPSLRQIRNGFGSKLDQFLGVSNKLSAG
ncbi:hypothetical protein CesoFtcFv8_023131 [Champsocephalus esox]|uniref:Uncharacterized protein n=1 Tax=Champsocephalus esox TaxID=159716 RepID=A0AAN8B8V3_9TELE|nr:hypothetical protein CesoFtcFv8_023131 [Champsocephalus esox]